MMQVERNLIDPLEGFLRGTRLPIHDRSSLFSGQFRQPLRSAKVEGLRLPARSPNFNAFAERFGRTIRQECLARMIFFGEASLRQAVEEFVTHYNHERNDQALDNKIIQPDVPQFPMEGEVRCRKRDGGLLRYYYRETASSYACEFLDSTGTNHRRQEISLRPAAPLSDYSFATHVIISKLCR